MNSQLETIELLRRAITVAGEVPLALLESFCLKLASLPDDSTPDERFRVAQSVLPMKSRSLVTALFREWCTKSPQITPQNLAWALRAAGHTDEFHRNSQSTELVWTGPQGESSKFRRTDQALLELINSAKKSLFIVTFAAYKIPHVATALRQSAERNVEISIILESKETTAGQIAFAELKTLGDKLAENTAIYVWPFERRPVDESGNRGALHVKCAVADDSMALVSSANLTGHAFNLNMELGMLVQGGPIPLQIAQHLRRLVDQRILEEVSW
jgi:phosphatidylserine/phosphatidylglycerophosphate/cardiolipin synthase-like enzyme